MANDLEEDIKDIEKYISFTGKRENFRHDTDWYWNKDLASKMGHVLSDYKKLQEEFKQVDHECDRLEKKEVELEKENSIEETIKIIEKKIKEAEHYSDITGLCLTLDEELRNALMNILSDYKRVLEMNEVLLKENKKKDKLIERTKKFLLKENKMFEFLESEE